MFFILILACNAGLMVLPHSYLSPAPSLQTLPLTKGESKKERTIIIGRDDYDSPTPPDASAIHYGLQHDNAGFRLEFILSGANARE